MNFRIRTMLALLFALGAVALTVGMIAALGITVWQDDGVEVCGAANEQYQPQAVSDGAGGAIITWEDTREQGISDYDIYAQLVDGDGNALWIADGVSLCADTSLQRYPQIAPDGSGGAIVAWTDERDGDWDIYAQRVDGDGNALWTADGISLCAASEGQQAPEITPDGSGGAIVTWEDFRGTSSDIYAQRVDGDGNTLWAQDGVSLCTATGYQMDPQVASDGDGGAIVSWSDKRNPTTTDFDVYAQRVLSGGTTLWQEDGVSLSVAADRQWGTQIVMDGSGGAIVTWRDKRYASQYDVYAQRVDASGNTLWFTHGMSLCLAVESQDQPRIAPDGSGGAVVVWQDDRGSSGDIYAQRVDSSGNTLWYTDGVSVCVAVENQSGQQIVSAGSGDVIIIWTDQRPGTHWDIYAQYLEGDGNALWHFNGTAVCVADENQELPKIVSDGSGGAIVAWADNRVTGTDIYAQRVRTAKEVNLPLVAKNH
jgi:hypothetical protein